MCVFFLVILYLSIPIQRRFKWSCKVRIEHILDVENKTLKSGSSSVDSGQITKSRLTFKLRVYCQFCIETIHGRLKRKREFSGLFFRISTYKKLLKMIRQRRILLKVPVIDAFTLVAV